MSFQFNEGEFKRLVQKQVQAGIDRVAAEQSRALERLHQQYSGKPVEQIKPELQRLFHGYGGNVTDPKLSELAQLVSEGRKIEFKPERIRF